MKKVRIKIEIPKGSRVKYEINKDTGILEVDRILNFELPYNYGYVPETLWADGDPLDVILLGHFSLHPGCEADVVPVALVQMYDNGESDFKLVCAMEPVDFTKYSDMVVGFLKSYKSGVNVHGYTVDETDIDDALVEARALHIYK